MGEFSTLSTTACKEWLSTCSNEGEGLIGGSTSENRTCAPCRAGQYASSSDDECIVCLPGSETDTHNRDGATTCVECPIGKINNSSEEICEECPGKTSSLAGSTDCNYTVCEDLFCLAGEGKKPDDSIVHYKTDGNIHDCCQDLSVCRNDTCNLQDQTRNMDVSFYDTDSTTCCESCPSITTFGSYGTPGSCSITCDDGYILEGEICVEKRCSCSNGVGATNTACTVHNTEICTECTKPEYTLDGELCVDVATCPRNGGDSVLNEECGVGYISKQSDNYCVGITCDITGVAEDKRACCVKQDKCDDTIDCGEGYRYNSSNVDEFCEGVTCDPIHNSNDRDQCCIEITDQCIGNADPIHNVDCSNYNIPNTSIYIPRTGICLNDNGDIVEEGEGSCTDWTDYGDITYSNDGEKKDKCCKLIPGASQSINQVITSTITYSEADIDSIQGSSERDDFEQKLI